MGSYANMTQAYPIILVTPNAHYPVHNWPITVGLMRALRRKGKSVEAVTFSTGIEPVPPDLQGNVTPSFSRMPALWRRIAARKWQERRLGGLMNVCETLACFFSAWKLSRKRSGATLHFIGGSYWIVALAALCFRRLHFVYSLYGSVLSGPATGLKAWIRPQLRRLLWRATATGRLEFTCENEFVHEEVAVLVGSHVHLIPYAIDDSEKPPTQEEARRYLNLPSGEKIILFFGTHRREKDYDTALKGCLAMREPPLALFVGKVISSNDPQDVVAECGYPNARIVNEFVPEEMAKYYFAAADAVTLPYEATFSRGSGVLIESCRHLRPLIASATPYFSAFLARYQCGVTYVPGDSASFAEAAKRLLENSKSFQPALEQARHAHSWSAAAEKYTKLYKS